MRRRGSRWRLFLLFTFTLVDRHFRSLFAAAAVRVKGSSFTEVADSAVSAAGRVKKSQFPASGETPVSIEEITSTDASAACEADGSRGIVADGSVGGSGEEVVAAVRGKKSSWAAAAGWSSDRNGQLLVAGTVDGQVHALEPDTGEVRWSFSTGEALVKSYQQSPGALDEKRWLIPALDGSLLVQTAQGLRRPPFNTRTLVEQTPFMAPGGTFYTGSKNSRIWGVDAQTGEVRQVLSGETADSLESDLKLLARSGSDGELIWIGRKDYTVRAYDVPTGQEQWNLAIGEFVSLDGFYSSSDAGKGGGGGGAAGAGKSASGRNTGTRGNPPLVGSRADPMPTLVATPEGLLRLAFKGKAKGDTGSSGGNRPLSPRQSGGLGSRGSSVWSAPLPAHVASVFQVALEDDSARTYMPLQRLSLSQTAADGTTSGNGGTTQGSAGNVAVGILDNGQVYAVALDELRQSDGEDSVGGDGGSARNTGGGGVSRGKKNRAGDGNKVTQGGRASATQPLLPHSSGGGDWQRSDGDSADYGAGEGGGHGLSSSLVQSWSQKGPHHGELRPGGTYDCSHVLRYSVVVASPTPAPRLLRAVFNLQALRGGLFTFFLKIYIVGTRHYSVVLILPHASSPRLYVVRNIRLKPPLFLVLLSSVIA